MGISGGALPRGGPEDAPSADAAVNGEVSVFGCAYAPVDPISPSIEVRSIEMHSHNVGIGIE